MDCNNKQILFLLKNKYSRKAGHLVQKPGMRIRIRSDPLIFGLPDPDPLLFQRIRTRILPVTTDI